MELDDLVLATGRLDQALAQLLREVGLAGAGWAVEHELALVVEQVDGLLQPLEWEQQFFGQLCVGRGDDRFAELELPGVVTELDLSDCRELEEMWRQFGDSHQTAEPVGRGGRQLRI